MPLIEHSRLEVYKLYEPRYR